MHHEEESRPAPRSSEEAADHTLSDRARAFPETSKAIRAELEALFAVTLAEGIRSLHARPPDEADMRLVTGVSADEPAAEIEEPAGATEAMDEISEEASPALFEEDSGELEEMPPPDGEADAAEWDDEYADDEGDDPQASEDDRPTAAQIAQYLRDLEEAEDERSYRASRQAEGRRPRSDRAGGIKRFFVGPDEAVELEPQTFQREVPPAVDALRYPRRDRLAVVLSGALIGVASSAAIIRFILL